MTMKNILSFVAVSSVLAALGAVACSSSASGNLSGTDGGAVASDAGADARATRGELSCLALLDCASACGDGDDACTNSCLERGSADGRDAAVELARCYTDNACEDAACLQDRCASEAQRCSAQRASTGGKPVTGAPTGSVPPALVGKWHRFYAPTANTEDITIDGDGTASRYVTIAYAGIGGCTNTATATATGTVVVTGASLTFYQTDGTQVTNTCGREHTESAPHESYTFDWSIDGGRLSLLDTHTPACVQAPTEPFCTTVFDKVE